MKKSRGSMKLTKSEKLLLYLKKEYKDVSCINCYRGNRIYSKKRPVTFFCEYCKFKNTYPFENKKLELHENDYFLYCGNRILHIKEIRDRDNILIDELYNNYIGWERNRWDFSDLRKNNNRDKLKKMNMKDIIEFINETCPLERGTKLYLKDVLKEHNISNIPAAHTERVKAFTLNEAGQKIEIILTDNSSFKGSNEEEIKSKVLEEYNILINNEIRQI